MLRSSCQTADVRTAAKGTAAPTHQVGVYLTDEVFLYRVDSVLRAGAGEMVDIEDCYWLDVVRVSVKDLGARGLRVVTPRA
jgi:hypothetical protein